MPAPERQLYLGIDVGRITGTEQYGNGKVMSGATVGIRGSIISTQYDLFIGTPLIKPNGFHTDPATWDFHYNGGIKISFSTHQLTSFISKGLY
jgi:hemolysin activation/secretion protein